MAARHPEYLPAMQLNAWRVTRARSMRARNSILRGILLLALSACGSDNVLAPVGTGQSTANCNGSCASAGQVLAPSDVEQVLAQGINEARARGRAATLAVVDRVGNVLAVYRMGAASSRQVLIASSLDSAGNPSTQGGLEGIRLPVPGTGLATLHLDDQAAIAKAVTAAYLSTEGNAFSTRTASQIIGKHFDPQEQGQPSGPLFGVQFSQLACSDFSARFNGSAPAAGPHRSPLGLSADPGGFPLYKGGTVVGAVGALADGLYSIDNSTSDTVIDEDEAIAYAATYGFGAPIDRRADQITIAGRTLRFSDIDYGQLAVDPAQAPGFSTLGPGLGALIATNGYAASSIQAGLPFDQGPSGIRPDGGAAFPGQDAFVFVDDRNAPRYAPRNATDGVNGLTGNEVTQVLRSALSVASEARSQIRLPLGTQARVTIAVVDTNGVILGIVASRDAPLFGADVSVQKARSAAFFSSASAAAYLAALPDARYLTTDSAGIHVQSVTLSSYTLALQGFLADPTALIDGVIAYSNRSIGNLSRPLFPDGIDGSPPGPLSKPPPEWSPFSTGLQLDLSINAILQHVLFVAGAGLPDVFQGASLYGEGCTGVSLASNVASATRVNSDVRLGNGLQIFAGSVPIFRGSTLVGAIGVSGDGVDQDDMVAILGLAQASNTLQGAIGNAPSARRADTLSPQGVRLKYVQCPQAPFTNSTAENVCAGL
jgi:uncharacterized protein GlcG (DUF336 family)